MDTDRPAEPAPPDNVSSFGPKLEQRLTLERLYAKRGESALINDIDFAIGYLQTLFHVSHTQRRNYLASITTSLREPATKPENTADPVHATRRHLVEIMEQELYDSLPTRDHTYDDFFEKAREAVHKRTDYDGPELTAAKLAAIAAIERLHHLSLLESNMNDEPIGAIEEYVDQIVLSEGI